MRDGVIWKQLVCHPQNSSLAPGTKNNMPMGKGSQLMRNRMKFIQTTRGAEWIAKKQSTCDVARIVASFPSWQNETEQSLKLCQSGEEGWTVAGCHVACYSLQKRRKMLAPKVGAFPNFVSYVRYFSATSNRFLKFWWHTLWGCWTRLAVCILIKECCSLCFKDVPLVGLSRKWEYVYTTRCCRRGYRCRRRGAVIWIITPHPRLSYQHSLCQSELTAERKCDFVFDWEKSDVLVNLMVNLPSEVLRRASTRI